MELVIQVQILDEAVDVSLHANALGKGMNPSVLPSTMSNSNAEVGVLALVCQPDWEKNNWIQTSFTTFKNWLCHILSVVKG